ncbi:NAD(P)-binding protein [Aulographum hederae CBS 113979]|uniref:NAD(P)-binding protein n=1 Tax=Aulographum hederae CBS 113979 TaxID=1176131 RepID=A0A6G1GYL1_9PEZI|nr:NAD(P)-binding protein [Aulographum hederae CBS 113979]
MSDETHNAAGSPAATGKSIKTYLPATCEPPSEQNPPKQAVWIIFGATGHMGRSLVRSALEHGDKVTAVGWTQEHTIEQMKRWQMGNSLGLLCDVRVRETVEAVIKKSLSHWGKIDIIANCTGYGVIGACEDQDEHELRNQFESNFFGTLNILQLSLPYFRSQQAGRYLIFSSISGALGVPGLGPYCATKYAVEGLIESMLYEVDSFNIKATLVEPGHLRQDEPEGGVMPGLKRYSLFKLKPPSEPYSSANAPSGHARRLVTWMNDRQPTSAVKSADLVWQLAHCSYPPLRLILGSYAVDSIRDRLRSIIEEIEDWKHLNFPIAPEDEEQQHDDGD